MLLQPCWAWEQPEQAEQQFHQTLWSRLCCKIMLNMHKCLGVKWRTLLPPTAFCSPLGFVSLCRLDHPWSLTWSEWKKFPWFLPDWKLLEHFLLMSRRATWRTWSMASAEWQALLVLQNGKFHAHRKTRLIIKVEEEWNAVPVVVLWESFASPFAFLNAFCEHKEFSLSVWCCFPLYQHFSQNSCKHVKNSVN